MNRRSDNTFGGARPLQFNRIIRDSVGERDRIDIYKFNVSSTSSFFMSLTELRRNANVKLLNNRAETIATSNQRRDRPEPFAARLDGGTYYLRVQYVDRRGTTPYNLRTSLIPRPNPPTPRPPPPPDDNNSIATAFDIGTLTRTYTKEDFVGGGDLVDFYRFTLSDITNLKINIEQFGGDGGRYELIRDNNNNQLVDPGEIYRSDTISFSPINMPPGTYFLRVSIASRSFQRLSPLPPIRYRLNFVPTLLGGNISPDPGSTLATAFDLGVYSGTRSIKEYVGEFDTTDLYQFTLNDLSNLRINTAGVSTTQELYRDDNGNGSIEANEVYDSQAGSLNTVDLPPGTYFLGISNRLPGDSDLYEMTLAGTPYGGNGLPDPGNTLPAARDLGVVSGLSSLKEYVGRFDSVDVYKFMLNSTANLQARITRTSFGNINIYVARDANNNSLLDNNETISSGIDQLTSDLQAGTYFLWLQPRFSEFSTNYQLDLITTP